MPKKTIQRCVLALSVGLAMQGLALADVPDIGGIRLGMGIDEALKILNNDKQNQVYVRNEKMNLKLTVDGNTGTFDNYVYGGKFTSGGKIIALSASPLTNKVWMISKIEGVSGDRPSLKAIGDAAAKFGKVVPESYKPNAFGQHWMYDKSGKEIEWVNVYDKPKNGNCFDSLQQFSVAGYYVSLNYPVAPTTACTTVYSVGAKSTKGDGLTDSYWSSATDVAAFIDWYKVITNARTKALEAEGSRAAKPSL